MLDEIQTYSPDDGGRACIRALDAFAQELGLKRSEGIAPRLLFFQGGDPTKTRDAVIRAAGWGQSTGAQILAGSRRITLQQAQRYASAIAEVVHPSLVPKALLGLLARRLAWVCNAPKQEAAYVLGHVSVAKTVVESAIGCDSVEYAPEPSIPIQADDPGVDPGAELRD